MGTRGFIGFVIDDTEKIAYNHWDSYPSGLGLDTLTWLRTATEDTEQMSKLVRELRPVDPESKPTPQDVERLAQFTDMGVGNQSTTDWYCLLRDTQGKPGAMLAAGLFEDAGEFPQDSLFAEWGYIVDLDAGEFQVYEGFQAAPHDKGRFANRASADLARGEYHPVALVKAWPLTELPSDKDLMSLNPDD